jgi:hypothetical protein
MKKRWLLILLCSLGIGLGCSGNDSEEEGVSPETGSEEDTVQSGEEPAEALVDAVEEEVTGETRVGEEQVDDVSAQEDSDSDESGEGEPDVIEDAEVPETLEDAQEESDGDVPEPDEDVADEDAVEEDAVEEDVAPGDAGESTFCGELSDVPPIDCTEGGDMDAACVFQHHCLCSNDFICAEEPDDAPYGNKECEPGVGCIPDPLAGSYGWSCGQASQGLTPVDCGEFGDEKAFCIYSNHCSCSEGFVCTELNESTWECAPGATCVPVE